MRGYVSGISVSGTSVFASVAAALVLVSSVEGWAQSDAPPARPATAATDRFVAAPRVTVATPTTGDLLAAGGNVDVSAPVTGDLVTAGGTVRLSGASDDLYAAGGQLTVNGAVAGSARLAGGSIEIGPSARIGRNITAAGGEVRVDGTVDGDVRAAGGRVYLNGPVRGSAEVSAGQVELGPNARIDGKLRVRSREALRRDPGAQVAQGVEELPFPAGWTRGSPRTGVARAGFWLWTLGLMFLAGIVVRLRPQYIAQMETTVRSRFGVSLLTGFALLVTVPAAAVVLFVTLIGAPLGFLTLLAYLALLLLGYVSAAIVFGETGLAWLQPAHAQDHRWRIGAAVAGVLAVAIAGQLPWVGGVIMFLTLLLGLGASGLLLRSLSSAREPQTRKG
jgi:cytoskeletal protein CcmA (bactofilin family)